MSHTECDKGPLIDKIDGLLTEVRDEMKSMSVAQAKVTQAICGNGVPGLAAVVEDHAERIESIEGKMLTSDVLRGMYLRIAGMIVAAVGLTATVLEIVQGLSSRMAP